MYMTHLQRKALIGKLLICMIIATSCNPSYKITNIDGGVIKIDSKWDIQPDSAAIALFEPYKLAIDSMVNTTIGESDQLMTRGAPESLLSNLVADVLRQATTEYIGVEANVGIVNMGGLRNDLPKGEITKGVIYEILPFENSLCILTVNGKTLMNVFKAMAQKKGDGLSGAKLVINNDGKLLSATVNNKPIDPDKLYSIATIDYLADGNDGLKPLVESVARVCPKDATLRDLFIKYVTEQGQKGNKVTSKIEGRIQVK